MSGEEFLESLLGWLATWGPTILVIIGVVAVIYFAVWLFVVINAARIASSARKGFDRSWDRIGGGRL